MKSTILALIYGIIVIALIIPLNTILSILFLVNINTLFFADIIVLLSMIWFKINTNGDD